MQRHDSGHAIGDFLRKFRSLPIENMSSFGQIPDTLHCASKKFGKLWSVRVGLHYRALAVEDGGDLVWMWIGTHAEYDQLIQQMQ